MYTMASASEHWRTELAGRPAKIYGGTHLVLIADEGAELGGQRIEVYATHVPDHPAV